MGETANIALMAKKVSDDIFGEFGWSRKGPIDTDWNCTTPEKHACQTHPSDVVQWYEAPYEDSKVFLNIDLKSYAVGSLKKAKVRGAITSLCKATDCANVSGEWRKHYGDDKSNYRCHGLLFVYNHDGEYDGDFEKLFVGMEFKELPLSNNNRVFVFSPDTVNYLANVAIDIRGSRGRAVPALPSIGKYGFYYPDLIGLHPKSQNQQAASIEVLLSPWQIIRYNDTDSTDEERIVRYIVYYRGKGESVDEFKYLFDAFFRFQMLGDDERILVKMPFADKDAHSHFQSAKDAYVADFYGLKEFRTRLNRIEFEPVTNIVKKFSEIHLGFENE